MKQIYLNDRKEEEVFALTAAKYFELHPEHTTFTLKDIVEGCWFAIRWGMDKNCVVVFKLDEYFEPQNYCNIINKDITPHDTERSSVV